MAPALTLCERVLLVACLCTWTLWLAYSPVVSFIPSVVGPPSPCTCWRRTESPDCPLRMDWCCFYYSIRSSRIALLAGPIVRFARLRHLISEKSVLLSSWYIKLFELGVQVAFNNGPAVAHDKVNLLKFSRQSSCSERTDDAFVLLICFCSFYVWESLFPVCLLLNSKAYTSYRASLIVTLRWSGHCPRNNLRKNTPDRSCTVSPDFFWLIDECFLYYWYCQQYFVRLLRQMFLTADS